jgi:tetratricopeptide (TPR) repeat protein
MPSGERHLGETDLLALALEPGAPRNAHVESCPECRRRISVLSTGLEHLGDLATLPGPGGATPLPAPPAGFQRLDRTREDAETLVGAAEAGEAPLAEALVEAAGRDGFPEVALQAVQIAARLALKSPRRAVSFAARLREAIAAPGTPDTLASRLAAAASRVLESQGLLYAGDAAAAAQEALEGLTALEESGAPLLLLSQARYYAGSACWGESRYEEALRHLVEARDGFAEDGQDPWIGRAEAAIGLVHFSEARFLPALHAFDAALERLDPAVDPGPVASTMQNRAGILMNLGRAAEARAAFGSALELALRSGLSANATTIRVNLLNLGLDEGSYEEVRARGEKLVAQSDREGLAVDAYYARLALAEAQAALGNYGAVRALVEALRGDAPPEVRDDPDATALLGRLDAGDRDEMADRLRRLRHYLGGRDRVEAVRRA